MDWNAKVMGWLEKTSTSMSRKGVIQLTLPKVDLVPWITEGDKPWVDLSGIDLPWVDSITPVNQVDSTPWLSLPMYINRFTR